jgi:hypothetical protein
VQGLIGSDDSVNHTGAAPLAGNWHGLKWDQGGHGSLLNRKHQKKIRGLMVCCDVSSSICTAETDLACCRV